ncbi:thioesterase [Thiomicrorhabdus immobilis]|uniref:Thioesterase n=1 Tax=Thiomicrorhabdus immobilis TaxID=2791037 RepID=A0ABM7MED8_9GAMM|nr:acyl-CoA thioesterase [Thiomicrorhabdus immobilis]BCN93794.1 thioesterase [Thiomicrorhabdus immobilis]
MNQNELTEVFSVNMEARDHECDIQGVVNNAHYQHYFEHARHRFLLDHQIDFAQLAKQGINLMVAKIEIEYKSSIRAHDQFRVSLTPHRESRLKVCFEQHIYSNETDALLASAKTTVVTVDNQNKPMRNSPLDSLF